MLSTMRKARLQDVIVKSSNLSRERSAPESVDAGRPSIDGASRGASYGTTRLSPRGDQRHTREEHETAHDHTHGRPVETQYPPLQLHPDTAIQTSRGRGKRHSGSGRWPFIALGIGAIVILSSVALSLLFAGATVTVYPKQDTVVINATFTAGMEEGVNTLPFERIILERTASKKVVALGEEEIEERARGTITIFNEYSDTPQRLIKNTRFKSSEGRIYRIRESVEIPGQKPDSTPGSIDIVVYAEEPGEEYNMTGSDSFSIPGFDGLPQEGEVYARSVNDMIGGFVGVRRSVGESDRTSALEQLESDLRDELLAEVFSSADKPEGYHLFRDAIFFEFSPLPDEVAETDEVVLSLSGKLHGILFPEEALAQQLAQLTIGSYDGSPIRVDNIDDLSVSLQAIFGTEDEEPRTAAPWEAEAYEVTAEGKGQFIWEYDERQLARDLSGKEKQVLKTPYEGGLLEAYPGIDRVQASVRPFWKRSFPDDASDIVIVTELDD